MALTQSEANEYDGKTVAGTESRANKQETHKS